MTTIADRPVLIKDKELRNDLARCARHSQRLKDYWADPAWREKQTKLLQAGRRARNERLFAKRKAYFAELAARGLRATE